MSKEIIVYHTNWSTYGRNYQVKDIPIDRVTTIAYSFVNLAQKTPGKWEIVSGDAYADFDKRFTGSDSVNPPDSWVVESPYYGNLGQFRKLKEAGKKFDLVLAIGGWTWSAHFSDAVLTAESRTSLVASIRNFMIKYPIFSGVAVDWEYPSNDGVNYGNGGNVSRKEDGQNLVIFLKELRKALPSPKYKLSMCFVAAPEKLKLPIEEIHPLLDRLELMTYDFHSGAW